MNFDDRLAELWAGGATLSQIEQAIGVSRGVAIGRIHRLRRAGDARFAPRPPKPKVRRIVKPVDEVVGNSRPLPPTPEPSGPRLLIDLDWRGCRWPMGEATDGRHLFCGRPQAPGRPYCPACIERAKGGAAPSPRFVLRAAVNRPR